MQSIKQQSLLHNFIVYPRGMKELKAEIHATSECKAKESFIRIRQCHFPLSHIIVEENKDV